MNRVSAFLSLVLIAFVVCSASAEWLLTTEDAQVDSWGGHDGTSTVLSAGDGAFAGERIWHSYIRFDLPELDAGESFVSAELKIYQDNFWSWTAADPYSSQAAFRVWKTDNTWDPNTITWATQPEKFQLLAWPLTDEGDLVDTQLLTYGGCFEWHGFDVLDAMVSGETVSFVLDCDREAEGTEGGGGIWFHSSEQGWGPRIEYVVDFDTAAVDITSLDVSQDCYVDSWNPDTVFNGVDMLAGNFESGRGRAALLKFDLPTLEAGEDFYNAYLSLYLDSLSGDADVNATFIVYDINSPWDETTCTYNTMPTYDDILVSTLKVGSADVQGRVKVKVLDLVKAAGSGGTADFLIYWEIAEFSENGQTNVALWKTKDTGDAQLVPQLELVLTVPPECSPALQADITGDCKVDFKDFAIMASEWLACNWSDPSLCD